MDKIGLRNKIRALDGLTHEEKSALIGLLHHQKKYDLVWEDKPEAVEERLRDELSVLHEVKERAILSEATDAPNHKLPPLVRELGDKAQNAFREQYVMEYITGKEANNE